MLQKSNPPFGGFNVTPPGKAKRLHMSPGPIFEPQGHDEDFGGAARALFAAGFRAGDIVHNSFSYHLTPGAFILETGRAHAGLRHHSRRRRQHRAAARGHRASEAFGLHRHAGLLEDTARYRGEGRQGRLVDQAGRWYPVRRCRRRCARNCAIAVSRCCNATPSRRPASSPTKANAREGMIVNETLLIEIVRPGTGDPVAEGEVGEVVVTSFNPDYPMIRLATGDLSAVHAGRLALRTHQHAHQGLDGPRRPDHQGEGHVRASRRHRGGRQAPSGARPGAASRSPARPSRTP